MAELTGSMEGSAAQAHTAFLDASSEAAELAGAGVGSRDAPLSAVQRPGQQHASASAAPAPGLDPVTTAAAVITVALLGAALEPLMRLSAWALGALARRCMWLVVKLGLWGVAAAALLLLLYLSYKLTILMYRVLTFKDEALTIQHDCNTPNDYDHRPHVQQVRGAASRVAAAC